MRIRLIEERVLEDDMDGARTLVRDSPDEAPLPPELQYRLHTLMTQGRAALAHLVPAEELDVPTQKTGKQEETSPATAPSGEKSKEKANTEDHHDPGEAAEKKQDSKPREPGKDGKLPRPEKDYERSEIELKKALQDRARKLKEAEEDFVLAPAGTPHPHDRQPVAGQRVSAFSSALVFHIICLFMLGFVVVSIPTPEPPKLIATVAQEFTENLTPTRITRTTDPKPAAASAPPANVIGSQIPSAVNIPAMEDSPSIDVTTLVTGIQPVGVGMSFKGDNREMSDVNFFGIAAAGKRIVFIIDATKYMLLDEKGGMYAYDKVKDEIAAMLAGLNRGTHFNILLYEGKRCIAFREEPVPGLPSNLRLAIEWLDPLNRTYEDLGLGPQPGVLIEMGEQVEPIQNIDLNHYLKPIQKALEWEAGAIFCIASAYRRISQSPTPEMLAKYREELKMNPGTPGTPGTPGEYPPGAQEKWRQAQERTRQWLRDENAARAEKGLPPKVVIDFGALIREVTGESPPRRVGGTPGTPGTPGARYPSQPPHTPGDIEDQVKNSVKKYYKAKGIDEPSIHMVMFIGEDEELNDPTKDHFRNLTRRNNGKLKILKGLMGLEDVTKKR